MKLPTLLITLLSTAAIAGQNDVYLKPACYVNNEPQYLQEDCPTTPNQPAYHPISGASVLPRKLDVISPPIDRPTTPFVDPYPTTSRAPAGGLYLIDDVGNGNYNIVAPDGGLTICSSSSCFH